MERFRQLLRFAVASKALRITIVQNDVATMTLDDTQEAFIPDVGPIDGPFFSTLTSFLFPTYNVDYEQNGFVTGLLQIPQVGSLQLLCLTKSNGPCLYLYLPRATDLYERDLQKYTRPSTVPVAPVRLPTSPGPGSAPPPAPTFAPPPAATYSPPAVLPRTAAPIDMAPPVVVPAPVLSPPPKPPETLTDQVADMFQLVPKKQKMQVANAAEVPPVTSSQPEVKSIFNAGSGPLIADFQPHNVSNESPIQLGKVIGVGNGSVENHGRSISDSTAAGRVFEMPSQMEMPMVPGFPAIESSPFQAVVSSQNRPATLQAEPAPNIADAYEMPTFSPLASLGQSLENPPFQVGSSSMVLPAEMLSNSPRSPEREQARFTEQELERDTGMPSKKTAVIDFGGQSESEGSVSQGENPIDQLLAKMVESKASDMHLTIGQPIILRVHGDIVRQEGALLTPERMQNLLL
ncbi:MAG: hypothetical protein NTV34_01560, partial [Proteobacteria bacterium]|nr:hypothetical protein [Pseudomonadota bacterium]